MNERIIEKLKILVGKSKLENEGVLSLVLDILIRKIKNYCNREDIPSELELIIVEMMREYGKSLDGGSEDKNNNGEVKAITRGKTRIEYNVGVSTKITSVDDLMAKYKRQLIRFKKAGSVKMNEVDR